MTAILETPSGATWIGPWDGNLRIFDGKEWAIDHTDHAGERDDITVTIHGTQQADGRVGRGIFVACPADPITADEARKLAAALIEAAAADEG